MSCLNTAHVLPTYKSILKHYNYVLDTVVYSPDSARYSNKTSDFCRVFMKMARGVILGTFVGQKSKQNTTNFAEIHNLYEKHR